MFLNWKRHITVDPEVQGGKPVIKGTRVPIEILVGAVASGSDVAEVAREYRITEIQVRAALAYAAEVLSAERTIAIPG